MLLCSFGQQSPRLPSREAKGFTFQRVLFYLMVQCPVGFCFLFLRSRAKFVRTTCG